MIKKIQSILVVIILFVGFFSYKTQNTYAFDENTNLELLIENKTNQDELKVKISKLQQGLETKLAYSQNNQQQDAVEVVSISFVEKDNSSSKDVLEEEISLLKEEILYLEKQLQDYMIEGTKIEKKIEENKKKYLQENNLTFIKGIWPVPSHSEISSMFGNRIHPITKEKNFHRGIDIPAPQDTDIVSSDDGIVIFSGSQNGYGNVVKIKHFDGKKTVYAHNNSNIAKEGDIVKKGQVIAKMGTTGDSTGNHVHFETIVDKENINPIDAVN